MDVDSDAQLEHRPLSPPEVAPPQDSHPSKSEPSSIGFCAKLLHVLFTQHRELHSFPLCLLENVSARYGVPPPRSKKAFTKPNGSCRLFPLMRIFLWHGLTLSPRCLILATTNLVGVSVALLHCLASHFAPAPYNPCYSSPRFRRNHRKLHSLCYGAPHEFLIEADGNYQFIPPTLVHQSLGCMGVALRAHSERYLDGFLFPRDQRSKDLAMVSRLSGDVDAKLHREKWMKCYHELLSHANLYEDIVRIAGAQEHDLLSFLVQVSGLCFLILVLISSHRNLVAPLGTVYC